MRNVLCSVLLVIGGLFLTGCGDDNSTSTNSPSSKQAASGAPTVQKMLTDAVTATEAKSGKIAIKLDITGQSDDPQIGTFLNKGLNLNVEGTSSEKAADLTGSFGLVGKDYKFGYRADDSKSYVQFNNVWYGPGPGVTETTKKATEGSGSSFNTTTTPADKKKLVDGINKYAGQVLSGDITEGDQVAGQKTWKFEGGLNADGLIKLIKAEQAKKPTARSLPNAGSTSGTTTDAVPPTSTSGATATESFSAEDEATLRTLVKAVKITVVTGQDDKRLYSVKVDGDISKEDFAQLAKDEADLKGKSVSAKVVFDVSVSDYDVEVPALKVPADARPFAELQQAVGQQLLGGIMQAAPTGTGGATTSPSAPTDPSVGPTPDGSTPGGSTSGGTTGSGSIEDRTVTPPVESGTATVR